MDHDSSNAEDGWWFMLSAGQLIAPIAVMLLLMPIFVGLRIWSQYLRRESIDAPCLCIIGGFASAVALSGLALSTIPLGLGQGSNFIDDESEVDWRNEAILEVLWITIILYTASLALSKFAVLLVYKKVFPTCAMRIGTLVIGILVLAWAIVAILVNVFACNPPSDFWHRFSTEHHGGRVNCISHTTFFSYNVLPNIIADILMVVLPIREVSKLQMTRRSKVQVSAVFALGSIVTVVAIIRFVVTLGPNAYQEGFPWIAAEPGLSVICACMPGMEPAVRQLSPCFSEPNLTAKARPRSKPLSDAVRLSSGPTPLPSPSKASIPKRIFNGLKDVVWWQPMSVLDDDYPLRSRRRTSEEMEEFRRLYEYSGRNHFSQDAYAQLSDTELFGGIRVEQTIDVVVETNFEDPEAQRPSNETLAVPATVYDGRTWRPGAGSAV